MGNGCTKQVENVYFRSRKEAAKQDARLCSREGASELLGVSPSTVADYELGNTKVVPVDKVDQMAELYNCPELRTLYCRTECPIGKRMPIATQVGCLESVALRFLEVYEASGSEEAMRRFRVVRMKYMDDTAKTVEEIAEIENLSDKTVYKDLGIACKAIGVYLSVI